ncbi:protein kinase [Mycobacterium sp. TNTM28]|uniref:non-specific serine/threonine protein kinase n=1 Tax=[Mycobacterium] fortunisiensis TaxID=2600579 RepID=A0ABS6KSZ4_9MYCO|nr:serine/threonine-protein kinase [[Mycobacterium] fortunisiensis]MBU9766600.1 protein kinase [[Mycobacterium] fortunisiensis]
MSSRTGTRFGRYELTALLGRGGMGEVYEAVDLDKDRTVAVKILREEYAQDAQFRARFLRESHAAAGLQEPHVVPIHDWGEIDGNLFIDMRLVRGQTLHELLGNGPLDPQRAVSIVEQIAAALDAAHAQGLVHRDVKPQNIVVTAADFAYLLDFGIAQSQGDPSLTQAGMQIGSLGYIAPERFGDAPCTPAADIYSLACVLYEALTAAPPFPVNSYERLISAHLSTPPPHPSTARPQLSPALDDVIARGMAKQPGDRYRSATELASAARRALNPTAVQIAASAETQLAPQFSPPVFASAQTPPPPAQSRPSLVPIAVVGVVSALLLGAVGLVIGLLLQQNSARPGDSPPTSTAAPVTVAAPTVYKTVSAPPTAIPPKPPTPTHTPTAQPESVDSSLAQLRQLAGADHAVVSAEGADRWVPQLSSKRLGMVAEGVVWDNARTLQEHLQLRRDYGAKLLWSGDWSTFDAANFWVTIAPISFDAASGALGWCRLSEFDRDHCYAKLISTTHGVPGSTAFN